jgi:hypothetical protein
MKLIIAIITGFLLCMVPLFGIQYNRYIKGVEMEAFGVGFSCFITMVGLAIVTVYFAERHIKENK